jgi:small subunit ribosomal protein S15
MCYLVGTMLSTTKKTKVIKSTAVHDKDTGSPEVQIALLTAKIEELARHLKKHDKDRHSRRGLLAMVANRQTHMKYLQAKHPKRYDAVAKKLELKK